MTNGVPFAGAQVPDLGAVRAMAGGQDPGTLVMQMILGSAGVTPGGKSFVAADGESFYLDETSVVVLFSQAGAQLFGLCGKDTENGDQRVMVPWHAIRKIEPRT